jgi:CHAT domain-containing protein
MLTRWEVKSPALTQLLTQFYSQQRSDPRITRSKSTALHQSLLKLRRSTEYHHPYYWAGVALIGDAR